MDTDRDLIRNISIVAHIDHGKSTLADRLIQHAQLVSDRDFRDQILDTMDIERERGITIKSNTVTMPYDAKDGRTCQINLIDTPGHVDFSYEVSRSLAACDGVLLVVDASQGVEAQTIGNLYKAMEHELTVVPVINKIDLQSADIDGTLGEIDEELGLPIEDVVYCSAKTGEGIEDVFEAIVRQIPPPDDRSGEPLRALIFDALYTPYRGTIVYFRVVDGVIRVGDSIRLMHTSKVHEVDELGHMQLELAPCEELRSGDVGYLLAGIKSVAHARVGDTITHEKAPADEPLPGFEHVTPMVFSSIYPMASGEYEDLTAAMDKLSLNDAALVYERDSSAALGLGFRCGFLGLLHLDVVQQRLEREYGLSLVLTAPTVVYRVTLGDGETVEIDNPGQYPDPARVERVEEPFVRASIMTPVRYIGPIMELCLAARGTNSHTGYLGHNRVDIQFDMPLAEIIYHFYDNLKRVTQGYGSLDYAPLDYRQTDVVKLDILVNGEELSPLSQLVHRSKAREYGLHACKRLEETIPRQQFKIALQAAIGGEIIARRTIRAYRKDVTAKCYGGDVTRKRKLLEKQRAGKKRMKMAGNVPVPQEAFVAVLRAE
ncbi:MAG: translation elongation factor 4, partial [Planctomycetota bacterium]